MPRDLLLDASSARGLPPGEPLTPMEQILGPGRSERVTLARPALGRALRAWGGLQALEDFAPGVGKPRMVELACAARREDEAIRHEAPCLDDF